MHSISKSTQIGSGKINDMFLFIKYYKKLRPKFISHGFLHIPNTTIIILWWIGWQLYHQGHTENAYSPN